MRHRLVLHLSLVFAFACGGGSKKIEDSANLDNRAALRSTATSPFLAKVDADAMYVYASLDPLPAPVLERAMSALREAAAPIYELIDTVEESDFETQDERMVFVIASALRDKLSVSGFRSIGLDLEQPFVLHSVGALPALRIRLADAGAFRSFVEGTASRAGVTLPSRSVGTQTYWSFPVEDVLVVGVAIQGSDLVVALAPQGRPEPTLERAFGIVAPETSLAQTGTLETIRTTYGIRTNMVGYIDLARMWTYVSSEGSPFARAQWRTILPDGKTDLPAACVEDGRALVAHAPRVVMGYRSFDERQSHAFSAIEISASLGRELRGMLVAHPWLEAKPSWDSLARISLGIDVGALAGSLRSFARSSWRCEPLTEVSETLAELTSQMDSPPFGPIISGIVGFHMAIDDLVPTANGEAEIRGHAILEHRDLDALLGVMSMGLGMPSVQDGAPPTQMPVPTPIGDQQLSIGRSGTALLAAMGESAYARAGKLVRTRVSDERPALTVVYDEARLYQLAERVPWLYELLDDDDNREVDNEDDLERFRRVDAALASGLTYGSVWFRERTIEIESITLMSASR